MIRFNIDRFRARQLDSADELRACRLEYLQCLLSHCPSISPQTAPLGDVAFVVAEVARSGAVSEGQLMAVLAGTDHLEPAAGEALRTWVFRQLSDDPELWNARAAMLGVSHIHVPWILTAQAFRSIRDDSRAGSGRSGRGRSKGGLAAAPVPTFADVEELQIARLVSVQQMCVILTGSMPAGDSLGHAVLALLGESRVHVDWPAVLRAQANLPATLINRLESVLVDRTAGFGSARERLEIEFRGQLPRMLAFGQNANPFMAREAKVSERGEWRSRGLMTVTPAAMKGARERRLAMETVAVALGAASADTVAMILRALWRSAKIAPLHVMQFLDASTLFPVDASAAILAGLQAEAIDELGDLLLISILGSMLESPPKVGV